MDRGGSIVLEEEKPSGCIGSRKMCKVTEHNGHTEVTRNLKYKQNEKGKTAYYLHISDCNTQANQDRAGV